jgi:hypothetical protein
MRVVQLASTGMDPLVPSKAGRRCLQRLHRQSDISLGAELELEYPVLQAAGRIVASHVPAEQMRRFVSFMTG